MEGRVDRAIIDRWRQRRLVRGDGRPGRGQGLEDEDNDEYQSRMEFPPDDVVAALTRLNDRQEETAEDNLTQHECAAGALCVAPSGADVSASTHRCLDCRGKIHCAMWCGENWKEYLESERCNITPDQLSAAGRASVQGSNHEMITICRVCINRLESRNADDDSDADDDSVSVDDSLATPRALYDDAKGRVSRESFAEIFYVAENRSLKALAILSLGLLNNDGTPTFNHSVLPWSAALRPTVLKMNANDLRGEVTRRNDAHRPGQWTVGKASEWLLNNPIVAPDEVAFIRATIAHRISVAERANIVVQPVSTNAATAATKGSSWVGKYPYLRLIHAIVDDVDNKAAYKRRLDVPNGRMAVENRKTQAAMAANVWHMVSEKWNDKSFAPTTSVKETHSDFARPIPIPFDVVRHFLPATPEKVEEKWSAMNLALKRGIQKWERSGQGDGGYTGDDDDDKTDNEDGDDDANNDDNNNDNNANRCTIGNLRGRPQRALDLRRNFFDDRNTYLLYLWDILDEHDLVQSSMQQLLTGIGSGNGSSGVPSVIGDKGRNNDNDSLASSKKSKGQKDDAAAFARLSSSIETHSRSLVSAAQISAKEQDKNRAEARASELKARINSLNDKKREMTIKMTEDNVSVRQMNAFEQVIELIDAEITEKKAELNGLSLATPTKSNRSPSNN